MITVAGDALGTSWRMRFVDRGGATAADVTAAVAALLDRIVQEMSQWEPASCLSRFNRAAAGRWMSLPPDFATVIAAALYLAERTGGAFDPTFGLSAALLGFGAEVPDGPPDASAMAAARAAAGWTRLAYEPAARRLRQPGGLWLDLSGIAKGHALDLVADLLLGLGMPDALVEIGGELVGRGLRPDGQPWWVDVETPAGPPLPPLRVALHDIAIATSGDYRRGAHTIDPASGLPLSYGVRAVSVIHARAMLADGWATALTVLGPERGIALAAEEGLAARMVVDGPEGRSERLSPALAAMIEADD